MAPDNPIIRDMERYGELREPDIFELRAIDDFYDDGDFEDICEVCGRHGEIKYSMCPSCREETLEKFKRLLHNEFDENQILFLDDYIEGIGLEF